ncbi:MAG: CRISPR-associated helicase Cas3' [Trueperaceae bacterium]|nr:CRISPR-associated helicase Cas3' [Trueperaceae bacterium]
MRVKPMSPNQPSVPLPNEPVAHTPTDANHHWHLLEDHLDEVAQRTRTFASTFSAGPLGALAGYLHDFGKYDPAFQDYLFRCYRAALNETTPPRAGSAPHAKYGARIANLLYEYRYPKLKDSDGAGGELAWVVLNHHGKLLGLAALDERLKELSEDADVNHLIRQQGQQLAALVDQAEATGLPTFQHPRQRAFFIRMLLSALVDADRLDTEKHADPERHSQRYRDQETPATLLSELKTFQASLRRDDTVLARARNTFFDVALERAQTPPGLFKMTIPTGGGKTLASLAFALEHARLHNLRRVVVALPYTSITQQTAAIYREALGAANVLEHHSSLQPTQADDAHEVGNSWHKLATENWDAPVIVTTTVQLFESLFSNRTSKVRKLHNLTQAVIVLDEAQTLSGPLIEPIIDAVNELTNERYGSSLVFCTATQPALAPLFRKLNITREVTEIAPDPAHYFQVLTRVRYDTQIKERWLWSAVADEMLEDKQALCIVNTKAQARDLYRSLREKDRQALHLSTDMCPAHRLKVIRDIREHLDTGTPCRVVSTQLIEAGVDLDFPLVLRALGPLDSIVQAAGRCNRNSRLEQGRVVVFAPEDDTVPPGAYRSGRDIARNLLSKGDIDLNDPVTFERYFSRLYGRITTDAKEIRALSDKLDFPEVAARFQMIDQDTEGVLVPQYDPEAVARILSRGLNGYTQRALQPYTVTLYSNKIDKYLAKGLLKRNDLDLLEWTGSYDAQLGIVESEPS